jgi:hypothetical protein
MFISLRKHTVTPLQSLWSSEFEHQDKKRRARIQCPEKPRRDVHITLFIGIQNTRTGTWFLKYLTHSYGRPHCRLHWSTFFENTIKHKKRVHFYFLPQPLPSVFLFSFLYFSAPILSYFSFYFTSFSLFSHSFSFQYFILEFSIYTNRTLYCLFLQKIMFQNSDVRDHVQNFMSSVTILC